MAVSVVIKGKNQTHAMFASIGRGFKSMRSGAARMGRAFVTGFAVASAAALAFAAKSTAIFSVQQRAEREVVAALNAHGEAGKKLLPTLKKVAAAIQDETGAADEATLAGMAKMRMLGVQTSKLEEAAKATLALKSIGLEAAAAQRYVALAMQGDYTMLQRYIPELRKAKSEQEKATIVSGYFARGYAQQAAVLKTVSGQTELVKVRFGDMQEEIGRSITQSTGLVGVLEKVGNKIKWVTQKIADWNDGSGLSKAIMSVKKFAINFRHHLDMIGAYGIVAWAGISDGASTAFRYIENIISATVDSAKAQFQYLADYAVAAFEKVKHPMSVEFVPPSDADVKKASKGLFDALKGVGAKDTSLTDAALQNVEDEKKAHIDRLRELEEEHNKNLKEDAARRVEDEKSANAEIEANAAATATAVEKIQEAKTKAVRSSDKRMRRNPDAMMHVDARVKSRTRMAGSAGSFGSNLTPSLLKGAGQSFSANLRRGGKDWVDKQVQKQQMEVKGISEQNKILRDIHEELK